METLYTINLKDFNVKHPRWFLDDIVEGDEMKNNRHLNLYDMIIALYWKHELFTTDYTDFTDAVYQVYIMWYKYYDEKLDWYETQINMLDGITATTTTSSVGKSIDLPRQNIPLEDIVPSGASLGDTTTTTKGNVNVIELKKEYEDLIKNIYLEFARKFEKCFITLYS